MTAHVTRRVLTPLTLLVSLLASAAPGQQRDDVPIADFEGRDYGDWKVEGEAFGPGPARGSLSGQMPLAVSRERAWSTGNSSNTRFIPMNWAPSSPARP